MTINCFIGEYRWLSNFWLVPITWNGLVFPSVENAYQASKITDVSKVRRFTIMTPGQSKRATRKMEIRPDWDDVKYSIMKALSEIKYQNDDLRAKLLATGNREIIEGNTWGDTYWGQCPIGTGQNMLGKIIMQIREDIRNG